MASEIWVVVWMAFVAIVGGNGFAAGATALLHFRRREMSRGSRVFAAAVTAGFLPASLMIVIGLTGQFGADGPIVWILAFTIILAFATLASTPGAIFMARKLEGAGDAYRAFE